MLFGTNLTRRADRDPSNVLVVVPQLEVARSSFIAGEHCSCTIFFLISMLRGQPKTPPSGDNLGVLDYYLNPFTLRVTQESIVCYFHTFENNLEIKQILTEYLKESCL